MSAGDSLGVDPPAGLDGEAPEAVDVGSGPWVKVLVAVTLLVLGGLVVAVIAFVLTDDDDSEQPAVVVDEAVDTRVVLACQVRAVAERGLRMPENTLVETGDNGHLVAGGVEMGPNRQAIVVNGELDVRPRGAEIANACDT